MNSMLNFQYNDENVIHDMNTTVEIQSLKFVPSYTEKLIY